VIITLYMSESAPPEEGNEVDAPVVLSYSSQSGVSAAAVVWCRLLALCMLGWGVQSLVVGLVPMIDNLPRASFDFRTGVLYFVFSVLPGGVWLILGWYCWAKAPSLADRMARGRTEGLSQQGMSSDELLTTLMIGIGIYLLTQGLPALAQYVYENLARAQSGTGSGIAYHGAILGAIVRCSLGLWLILGTRGILTIIRRHSGRWRDPAEPGG